MTTTTVFITSGTTWTVPNDWNHSGTDATIEGIGGGGAGSWGGAAGAGGSFGGNGGGGAAWARLDSANALFSPGDVVAVQVGAGGAAATKLSQAGGNGTDTFVKDLGGTTRMLAKGGSGGLVPTFHGGGGAGGRGDLSVGTDTLAGARGGNNAFFSGKNYGQPGGGGAAAGPGAFTNSKTPGTGEPGSNAGYGCGGGGGTYGNAQNPFAPNSAGGFGGAGASNIAGGTGGVSLTPDGTAGTNGAGGGGGFAKLGPGPSYVPFGLGGAGGAGTDMGSGKGAGGGSGGSQYGLNTTTAPPGRYGGGGGGRASYAFGYTDSGISVGGAQGIIRITYTPPTPPGVPTNESCGLNSTTFITAQWVAGSGGTPTSYTLQWRAVGAVSWTTITGIITTSHRITGLNPGGQYEWQVKGVNNDGSSAFSASTVCSTAGIAPNVFQPQSLGIWRGQVGLNWNGLALVGDAFTGLVGLSDFQNFTEYGNAMRMLITAPPIQQDRKRIFMPRFEVDMQVGDGVAGDPNTAPQLMLDYSRNGGVTFVGLQKWRSMGRVGRYTTRLRWLNMGASRSWVFRLTCTDAVRRQIIGVYADWYAGEG